MDDTNNLHCKACDKSFYPVYYEERGEYEELCGTCLSLAFGSEPDSEIAEVLNSLVGYSQNRMESNE